MLFKIVIFDSFSPTDSTNLACEKSSNDTPSHISVQQNHNRIDKTINGRMGKPRQLFVGKTIHQNKLTNLVIF